MRYLHHVAAHEAFVASGEYRYVRGETPLAVKEQWTIHELAGGARLLRVDEDGRDEDGLSILSEALVSPQGRIERFNVQSFNSRDPQIKLFKADYSFYEDYVQIGRTVQGQEREYIEFPLIENCLLYIKQSLYMGYTIRDILARDKQRAHVFTPPLLSGQEDHLQKLEVRAHDTETVMVGNKPVDANKYQLADDVFYWLDAHHIPVQREYRHAGALYRMSLHNYAHR